MSPSANHPLLAPPAGREGLTLVLEAECGPSEGYKLAADYCVHYDPRHGHSLNGPSRTKLMEIVRHMFTIEALEDDMPAAIHPGNQRT